MKKLLLVIVINLISFSTVFSQGIIRGKITDNTGEALIGAVVKLKTSTAGAVMADLDGNYSIKITDTTAQTIVVSYVSYKTQEMLVNPRKGEVIIQDFSLVSSTSLDEVVVVSKATKANNYYMEALKMKSSTTMDYISQETMKKTGDVNVVSAVARVSGVSSSSSAGYITVRGIGDRYVKTTINGSRIPTLDPFTNNIRLDLFPAFLVDNIILTKTASPDLPGDWAGAYVSVETKDYPDKLSVNIESYAGFNPQTTFKNTLSSDRSSTDWLGFDNGSRDHAHNANGAVASINYMPSDYQNFVGLGLGDYYHSLGITSATPWNSTYYDLGLVQLGLLNQSQLNDPNAIATATNAFNTGPYKNQAFANNNAASTKLAQTFKDNWNLTTRKTPPNLTQSFSIGNQINLFGRPLGFLAGFRYGTVTLYDPNSVTNRPTFTRALESSVNQQASQETNSWSGLVNLAYKYHPNHSITLLFMPNFTGANNVRNAVDNRDPTNNIVNQTQFYDQRKQLIYQLKSEHYLAKPKLRIELNASYTNGKSSAPDYKDVTYTKDANNTDYSIGPQTGNGVNRYYRYMKDNLFDSRLDLELPLGNQTKVGPRKLKFGGAFQNNSRKNDQYRYEVDNINSKGAPMTSGDLNSYFALSNFALTNNYINMSYYEDGYASNHTFGYSNIEAGYLMTDFSIVKRLRFSGGLRVEKAYIYTDAVKYDSLHYAPNDNRRVYNPSQPMVNPGKVDDVTFLPSANLIYKLKNDDDAPINLRANFSETVARPSIRELSDVYSYDYNLKAFYVGNSNLTPTHIKNYDVRLEWYFKNRDNISASVFYKDFRNNIELVNNGYYSWRNVDKSYTEGIEIDGKKSIIKNLDFIANVTFVKSNTKFMGTRDQTSSGVIEHIPTGPVSRPNFGQAPYIINAILTYYVEKLGLTATVSYNIQGKRLAITSAVPGVPDVYEMPRNMMDFKVAKKLGKYFSASFTVRDIFNTAIRRTYIYSDGQQIDYDKFRYGTTYNIGISYKL